MVHQVINNFVSAINSHSVSDIISLNTDNHKLIDSFGIELTGKDGLKRAWAEYFRMFPDYRIEVDEILANNSNAAIIGTAFGTYTEDGNLDDLYKWQISTAWYAKVDGKKIKSWRIYADLTPIIEIIGKYKENKK